MSDKIFDCSKGQGCCSAPAEIGTIVDNNDCKAIIENLYDSKEEAEQAFIEYTNKAKQVATEKCDITHTIEQQGDKYKLTASFDFTYQAETLIFQLRNR